MLQMSVNSGQEALCHTAQLRERSLQVVQEAGTGHSGSPWSCPNDIARRLMELGFLPGHTVVPVSPVALPAANLVSIEWTVQKSPRYGAKRCVNAADPSHIQTSREKLLSSL